MRSRTAILIMLAITLTTAATWAQDAAPANVQVTVDGAPVAFTRPILMVDMQFPLLPADTFLTALGATSNWNAGAQRLDVTLGAVAVQMWLGRNWVTVDGVRQNVVFGMQTLSDVPYVPGPETATLLGLDVQWDQPSLTLAIAAPTTMPDGPTIAATLLEVRAGPPTSLLVRVNESGQVGEAPLAADPIIQRGPAGESPMAAQLADLQPGDLLSIVFDEANAGVGVQASYAQTLGTIASIQGNQLTMQTGASYPLGEGVVAYGSDGTPLHLLAAVGQAAIITQNPGDNSVWRILAQRRGTTTPPALAEPLIASFTLPEYALPLGEGGSLQMRIAGTTGATASVALGNSGQAVNLPETAPGIYSGAMTVPAGMLVVDEQLVAQLEVGGTASPQVPSAVSVTIDAEAPVIDQPFPNNRSKQADANTNLRVKFADGQGTGVDETTAMLSLDGADVTADARIDEDQIFYDPPAPLAPGAHSATAQVADLLGNAATFTWTFEVPVVQVGILDLTHDAAAPLAPGATITVTMQVAAAGQAATFGIEGVVDTVPMARIADTNSYQGTYTVPAGVAATDATLTGKFTAADATPYEANAAQLVTITAPGVPFAVTTPQADVKAERKITPAGTAPAGSSVRWTVSYTAFILTGDIATGTVEADAAGKWQAAAEVDLKLLLIGMADGYTLTAELLDAAGAAVQTKTVQFKARG